MRGYVFVLVAVLALSAAATGCSAETRYDDVIYFDESKQPTVRLKVLHRTPITFSPDPQSVIGYLAEGQRVEVVGLGENQHYVSARVATGTARGWVDARALEAPPAELLARLQARHTQTQAHRQLIDRHEVAAGMTRAEVRASLKAISLRVWTIIPSRTGSVQEATGLSHPSTSTKQRRQAAKGSSLSWIAQRLGI
jgi:hypothetical protein